jgi:Zn ribbon nucleic-acid-binding protein
MERVIDCPHCKDTDSCFEEMQEQFSSFICFKCGFMSDSRFEKGGLQTIENEKSTPQLVTDLKYHDIERDIMWYPSVINMGKLGMIFPEGHPTNWNWRYAKVVDIPEDEQHLFEGYKQRLDIENALTFEKDDFMSACKEMGITKDLKSEK